MRSMSYSSTTDYYCESLAVIDERICELLANRKECVSESVYGILISSE